MMSTTLANPDLVDRAVLQERAARTAVVFAPEANNDDRQTGAARGIAIAVLISAPIWALIAVTVYLLL